MSKSSRVIDGLKTNTLYSFYVRAKNIVGQWSDLPTVVTRTTLKDTTTPAVLSSITLLMLAGMFQLKWGKPTTLDLRGGGFKIYVFTANTPASAVLIREVGYTADSAVILIGEKSQDASITIAAGTTYYFWVTTLDDSRNESAKVATTPGSGSVSLVGTGLDHHVLTNLLVDDHTQYALLAGRAGGQTLIGGIAASENLNLKSTSHATKGKIYFGANAYFDESLD